MFPLSNTILLRGARRSDVMDNTTISTKGMKRGLDKLESIIDSKNLRHSGILSGNLRDEVGDCSDNLRAVVEKIDPTNTSIIINKHNIITMTEIEGV